MKKVNIEIQDYVYEFYRKIGESAGGLSAERVMADALFSLAGKLAEETQKSRESEKKTDGSR